MYIKSMPKKRTARVEQVKTLLIEKIKEGHRRPGNWFLSNRELAGRYNISYQTAHGLIRELCEEGYLHRTEASGTYVASEKHPPTGVALILHGISKTEERRFGAILRTLLEERLQKEKIDYVVEYADAFKEYPPDRFCVIWGGLMTSMTSRMWFITACSSIRSPLPASTPSSRTASPWTSFQPESAPPSSSKRTAISPGPA